METSQIEIILKLKSIAPLGCQIIFLLHLQLFFDYLKLEIVRIRP